MLQWFDTLMGLVVILLAVSLIIMVLTQTVAALLNLRGLNLKRGLKILFENGDGGLAGHAENISHTVLSHPLISDKWNNHKILGLASTIRSVELINILKVLANNTEQKGWQRTLKKELVNIEQHIDNWFDKTMDRVTQSYVTHTRICAILFSLLFAFSLHLDLFHIFKQVSQNSELRASLVANSNVISKMAEDVATVHTNESNKEQIEVIGKLKDQMVTLKDELEKTGFSLIPDSFEGLKYTPDSQDFWGMLLMSALLSLGAPFWFNALKTMSSLRPILASKEAKERERDKP